MTTLKNYKGEPIVVLVDDTRDALLTDFGKATLTDRYLLKGETFQGMFARVSAAYSDDSEMAQRVYDAMSKHWFMPATPILSNGGTDRGNPISCFLNSVEDSLDSIAAVWNENVYLAAKGGGIGTYWGGVRSIGEKVGDVGDTSGIIPFIKVQDSLTLGISQGSLRRGSAAVYVDIHHPEIEEFLDIRRPQGDPNRKSLNIHHGIGITDAFMQAVVDGTDFNLISPHDGSVRSTVDARALWQKVLITRVETGEPYLIFTDTIDRMRPEVYKRLGLRVRQSNLCSEIALATGTDHRGQVRTAVCCLSSLNIAKMDEWFGNRQFIKDCLVFLDNVLQAFIDRTDGVPGFENARYAAHHERSIGLGKMGFHTYLQEKGIPFESAMAHAYNLRFHKWVAKVGAEINEEVARERGTCLDADDAGLVIRWSHMFATAPTASISIIAGGASACGEPWPANMFTQKTLSGSFEVRNQPLDAVIRRHAEIIIGAFPEDDPALTEAAVQHFVDQAWKQVEHDEGSAQNLTFLTHDERDTFKTAMEIDQRWVISHAAAAAPFIDQMSSINITLSADVHKIDLHGLHMKAWKDGVPSLYYCRSKSLQRGTKVTHTAGEMPQPGDPVRVVLVQEPLDYDECLACQ